MVVTVLAESPHLGPLMDETGMFTLGFENAVRVGVVLVKAIKFRHALAFGTFVIGSLRQHEAITHLASLRAPPVDGQVGTVLYGAVRYDTLRYSTVLFGSVRHGALRYGTVRFDMIRYGTVRYGTVRYGTVRYGTIWYGAIR